MVLAAAVLGAVVWLKDLEAVGFGGLCAGAVSGRASAAAHSAARARVRVKVEWRCRGRMCMRGVLSATIIFSGPVMYSGPWVKQVTQCTTL